MQKDIYVLRWGSRLKNELKSVLMALCCSFSHNCALGFDPLLLSGFDVH